MPAQEHAAMDPGRPNAEIVGVLVDNHRRFLSFLERRLNGDRALAEDVLQSAYVRGLERAGGVRSAETAVAWFFRLLRNALADHGRRSQAARVLEERLAAELDPDARVELERELCRCMGALAETLRPEYSRALRRVELEGASLGEFAREAGITANNAAVRVHRARRALGERLRAACGTCAEHGCLDCTCGRPAGTGGCAPPGSENDPPEV
jgi:RNA polymerase sigma-70 factor (ECF subfamily)